MQPILYYYLRFCVKVESRFHVFQLCPFAISNLCLYELHFTTKILGIKQSLQRTRQLDQNCKGKTRLTVSLSYDWSAFFTKKPLNKLIMDQNTTKETNKQKHKRKKEFWESSSVQLAWILKSLFTLPRYATISTPSSNSNFSYKKNHKIFCHFV